MATCLAESTLGTPPDTYIYTLASNLTHHAIIASDNSLRLFDSSLQLHHIVPNAHDGISSLTALGRGFATAGRDGLIRCWDSRAPQRAVSTFHVPSPTYGNSSSRNGVSALAGHSEHLLAAGTASEKEGLGDVSVLVYDTRQPGARDPPVRNFSESHTDSITQLSFHPTQPSVLLSASTDGLVSLFDLEQVEEEDALLQVLNPRSAVHRAAFLPGPHGVEGEEVAVLTTDEQFAVHSLAESKAEAEADQLVRDFGDVRETLSCTYVIGVEGIEQSAVMVVGNHQCQTLTIVPLVRQNSRNGPRWEFGRGTVALPGAHGEEIVRDFSLAKETQAAMTCGEDGRVKVWRLP